MGLNPPTETTSADDRVTALAFLYCISPVHVGSGSAIGPVDGPVQREAHTDWPTISGASVKGALRAHCEAAWLSDGVGRARAAALFGAKGGSVEMTAGAAAFGDAHLVLFPVRSLRGGFVHTTSPLALGRLARHWPSLRVSDLSALPEDGALLGKENKAVMNDEIVLEAFPLQRYSATETEWDTVRSQIADYACEAGFFRDKIASDLVVLPDQWFEHFARFSTLVEAHVRLDDASGAHSDQGLFFIENVPAETLFVSRIEVGPGRGRGGRQGAAELFDHLVEATSTVPVTVGGDRSTGRGLVAVRLVRTDGVPGHV